MIEKILCNLIKKNKNLSFDVYGMNKFSLYGRKFLSKISNSYMGINLSRGRPIKYYSSDRQFNLLETVY